MAHTYTHTHTHTSIQCANVAFKVKPTTFSHFHCLAAALTHEFFPMKVCQYPKTVPLFMCILVNLHCVLLPSTSIC